MDDCETQPLVAKNPPATTHRTLFFALSVAGIFCGLCWIVGFSVVQHYRLVEMRFLAIVLVVTFFVRLAILFLVLGLFSGNVF